MVDVAAKTAVWLSILGACLFLPAQTLAWPLGWALLATYGVIVVVAFATLDGELLRERARPGPGVDRRDAVIASVGALLLYPATLATAGFDSARHWSPPIPLGVSLTALAVFAAGYAFALWAMHANRFFSTFVRIQADRGHHVVDRGPYAWVRHPGYTGTLIAHLAMPLALGSLAALTPAVLACAVFVLRTAIEDRTLTAELDGYADYRRRVRWRLAPWLW